MKTIRFLAIVLMFAVDSIVSAQGRGVILTHPTVPRREVLDRLGLSFGWRTRITLPESPDSLRSVQLIPHGPDLQIAVQSESGSVYLLDAQTGDLLWSTPVGIAHWPSEPIAYNDQNIYTIRKNLLYVLDRRTGRQRVYKIDAEGARIHFGFALAGVPTGGPTANDALVYIPIGDRIVGLSMPLFEVVEAAFRERYGGLFKVTSVQPERRFGKVFDNLDTNQAPLVFGDQVSFVTRKGLFGVNRFIGEPLYRFTVTGMVEAPVGQYENVAYVPSTDSTLYAVNMLGGRDPLIWRFLSSAPIRKAPAVTDKYVFVTADGRGMSMLDRVRGVELWRNPQAETFLALSDRFVYAADRHGKLMILEPRKGTALGQLDMGEWQVQLTNEYTDRIFLANHDGQIMCLFPRGSVTPISNKTRPVEVKEPPVKDKEMEKKDDEKKDPEKKDDEKKCSRSWTSPQIHAPLTAMIEGARRGNFWPATLPSLSPACIAANVDTRRIDPPWRKHRSTAG